MPFNNLLMPHTRYFFLLAAPFVADFLAVRFDDCPDVALLFLEVLLGFTVAIEVDGA